MDKLHHLGRITPDALIEFVNVNYPQYKGICEYDKENKCLKTTDLYLASFHFDAIHCVLHIMGFEPTEKREVIFSYTVEQSKASEFDFMVKRILLTLDK